MHLSEIPEITRLSASEKVLLIDEIWDSIGADESALPVPRSHIEEPDRRMEEHEADPGSALALAQLQARLEKRM